MRVKVEEEVVEVVVVEEEEEEEEEEVEKSQRCLITMLSGWGLWLFERKPKYCLNMKTVRKALHIMKRNQVSVENK